LFTVIFRLLFMSSASYLCVLLLLFFSTPPPLADDSFAENAKRNVLVQAWAPLGGSLGGRFSPALQQKGAAVGAKYKKSWAQVRAKIHR
jgi:hypothetical protein